MYHTIDYVLTSVTSTLLCTTNLGFRVRESYLTKKPLPALMSLSFKRPSSAVQYSDRLLALQSDERERERGRPSPLTHFITLSTNTTQATVLQGRTNRCIWGNTEELILIRTLGVTLGATASWLQSNNMMTKLFWSLNQLLIAINNFFERASGVEATWVQKTAGACKTIALVSNSMQLDSIREH